MNLPAFLGNYVRPTDRPNRGLREDLLRLIKHVCVWNGQVLTTVGGMRFNLTLTKLTISVLCVCEQFDRRGVQPEEAEQNNNNSAVPDRQTNRVGKLRSATYLKLHVL